MMRIITGAAKGKRLDSPDGIATRPTSERIKEAIFSAIQFDLEGRAVLDLFAGSGQMALEALSRGAASAQFVDVSREAMETVKKNARICDYDGVSKYLVSDWKNYIRKAAARSRFDLVFVDPPYAMQCCREAAVRLASSGMLSRGAIVVLESGEEDIMPGTLSSYELIKSTHYGKKTFVNILFYKGGDEK